MTTEEELKDLRKKFNQGLKRGIEEKRVAIVVFGVISVTALCALVYAFFQQTAANKERVVGQMVRVMAEKEIAALKRQIREEVERFEACERARVELKSAGRKAGK